MTARERIERLLSEHPDYADALFARGYLLTDDPRLTADDYPFNGIWTRQQVGEFVLYSHPKQTSFVREANGAVLLLVGHAYDPFSMVHDENVLLSDCAQALQSSYEELLEVVSNWTGVFVLFLIDDRVLVVQDATGLRGVYFGHIDGYSYFSSHAQMIGDLCSLPVDPFVAELVATRMYKVGNRFLPGNMSPYVAVQKLSPNIYLTQTSAKAFRLTRFHPHGPHGTVENETQYEERLSEVASLLHANLSLASNKWKRPYISLSGGMDSRTTLAAANGLYDRLRFFSFAAKAQERLDAQVAAKLCGLLEVPHLLLPVPDANLEVKDFDILNTIIDHNDAHIRFMNDNEVRKQIVLYRDESIEVELKSWVSEISRVRMERRLGVELPLILRPRHFSIFQTRFFGTPRLLFETDKIYAEFLSEVGLELPLFDYEHADLYYWEIRTGSWEMMAGTSLEVGHTISYPWNNRRLLDLMLSLPRDDRKTDEVHRKIIQTTNPDLLNVPIVANRGAGYRRVLAEKIYFYYMTKSIWLKRIFGLR